jgi:rhodanese-related sulfurtransferase
LAPSSAEEILVLPPRKRFEKIDGAELFRRLALGKPVVLLDVRTGTEFAQKHIPGSLLVPLQDLDKRVADVPNSGTPIAVISECGLRGESACSLLAQHDCGPLLNLDGGLEAWPGPLNAGLETAPHHEHGLAPSSFLVKNFDLLPKGLALDLCMGQGRNAIYLATRGFDVDGVEVEPQAVARARCAARKLGVPIRALVGNVEDGTYIVPIETYDVIVVFNYLHRPVFKDVKDGVVPGGVVVYQTFSVEPDHADQSADRTDLLQPGELREVFKDWDVLRYRELSGKSREGAKRAIAGIIARKPE